MVLYTSPHPDTIKSQSKIIILSIFKMVSKRVGSYLQNQSLRKGKNPSILQNLNAIFLKIFFSYKAFFLWIEFLTFIYFSLDRVFIHWLAQWFCPLFPPLYVNSSPLFESQIERNISGTYFISIYLPGRNNLKICFFMYSYEQRYFLTY